MTTGAQTPAPALERVGPARGPGLRRWSLGWEVLLFLALMVLYELLRHLVEPDDVAAPLRHAEQIVDAERALGLFIEPDVQRITQDVAALEFLTTCYYVVAHTAGFVAVFVFLWFWRRERFAFVRTWFWITNGIAVLGYWLYPLAPPRLAGLGLSDPTAASLELGGSLSWFQPFRNLFAAMPSMHVGYPLLFALALTLVLRSRWRWLIWLWPATMIFTVMATANHFWLDAVGGAVAVGLGLAVALIVAPRLRRPWRHAPAPAG